METLQIENERLKAQLQKATNLLEGWITNQPKDRKLGTNDLETKQRTRIGQNEQIKLMLLNNESIKEIMIKLHVSYGTVNQVKKAMLKNTGSKSQLNHDAALVTGKA